jgi:hypothetical protein
MSIQLTRYFRVLVIGEETKFVGDVIEKDLGFRTRLVPGDQIEDAIRGSAEGSSDAAGLRFSGNMIWNAINDFIQHCNVSRVNAWSFAR